MSRRGAGGGCRWADGRRVHVVRYTNEEIALTCGAILKETLRHESLARVLLYSDESVGLRSQTACLL